MLCSYYGMAYYGMAWKVWNHLGVLLLQDSYTVKCIAYTCTIKFFAFLNSEQRAPHNSTPDIR